VAKLFLGCDIGSTTTKCVILGNDFRITGKAVVEAGAGTAAPSRAINMALIDAGAEPGDIGGICATGYGRNLLEEAGQKVSEITCHAKGAHFLFPDTVTVIDVGGQDAKVIQLDPEGRVQNFVMNDKCAAGTGRFLEVMARVLDLSLDAFSNLDLAAKESLQISSTCTVFAESEVISRLASGADPAALVAGINISVAIRTISLVKRCGALPPFCMTGGVSKNGGVIRALERMLETDIETTGYSQLAGALGAAIIALERGGKNE